MPATAPSCAFHGILRRHAAASPTRRALTFLTDGEAAGALVLDYGGLLARTEALARRLQRLRGERVLLLHPAGADFVIAFCACLVAGVVAVPLHPPTTRRLLDRVQRVAGDCRARALLTTAAGAPGLAAFAADAGLEMLATDLPIDAVEPEIPAATGSDAPAFLQYTSGSTGDPKGVVVTHGNLLCNSQAISAGFATGPEDVGVSWLPLHHDMGLVGSVVHILLQGMHCVHLTPEAMIRKPLRWLRAIAEHRATVSGGPDFAWRLLVERVAPADLAGLDLSCWRVAYSGAEPVRADSLERAARLLAPAGFRASAFLPCYGMAEATLMVSAGPAGQGVRSARLQPDGPAHVACGRPVPDGSVAIVDPGRGVRLPDGSEGEVWISGGHVAAGYWGRAEQSAAVFAAQLPGDDRRWLRSGDLGHLAVGQLHISGRIKDLLIVNGRKHHPEDVEATVQAAVADCAGGTCAAFQAGLQLVLAVELERVPADRADRDGIATAVRQAVWSGHGFQPDAVVFERLGRLPRTTSGKVRRAACAALHQDGRWAATGAVP